MSIKIKNISSATVVISEPNTRFRRKLLPGRVVPVSDDEYQELTFDVGFNSMVREHYIAIEGVEEGQEVQEVGNIVDRDAIAKMFDDNNITAFAKFIPQAAPAEKDSVVELAVAKKITNSAFTALIQKYCDVDVIQAINTKHLVEDE